MSTLVELGTVCHSLNYTRCSYNTLVPWLTSYMPDIVSLRQQITSQCGLQTYFRDNT